MKTAGTVRARARKAPTAKEIARGLAGGWEIGKFAQGLTVPQRLALEKLTAHDIVIFSAANFAGKTIWAVWVAVMAACGGFPWCPVPADIQLVGLTMAQARGAMQRYLRRFLPKEMVRQSTTREGLTHITDFWNGSTLSFGSCTQGAELHQGARRSLIVYDEEPTYEVFEEGLFRLRDDMPSRILFTMTPTMGRSWVFHDLWQKASEKRVEKVEATVFENGLPPCKTCGLTREQWDEILLRLRSPRGEERWVKAQTYASLHEHCNSQEGICGRCWTFGVEPRIQAQKVRDNLARVPDPKRAAMRFLGKWEELGGTVVFLESEIAALKTWAQAQPIAKKEGHLNLWELPRPGHAYTIGVDGARAVGQAESVITLLNRTNGKVVGVWGDNYTPWNHYIHDIVDLATEYHNARICVEWASAGEGIIPVLMRMPGLNLYQHVVPDKRYPVPTLDQPVGFRTSARSRNRVLMNLIQAIRAGLVRAGEGWRVEEGRADACYIPDLQTVEQLALLFYDEGTHEDPTAQGRGEISKPAGKHDDRVLALAFAWEARQSAGAAHAPTQDSTAAQNEARAELLWRRLIRQEMQRA